MSLQQLLPIWNISVLPALQRKKRNPQSWGLEWILRQSVFIGGNCRTFPSQLQPLHLHAAWRPHAPDVQNIQNIIGKQPCQENFIRITNSASKDTPQIRFKFASNMVICQRNIRILICSSSCIDCWCYVGHWILAELILSALWRWYTLNLVTTSSANACGHLCWCAISFASFYIVLAFLMHDAVMQSHLISFHYEWPHHIPIKRSMEGVNSSWS